ncbi:TPA: hypothetical protein KV183_000722 [Morganella morganii]|nr:hypothetical protein [Morganella morganii]HBH7051322.1 hypothetical protein [Morganella morganii]
MAKAAKIAKTDMEWWRHFEVLAKGTTDNWYQLNSESVFHHDGIYRFVPQPGTIKIGDYEVPEPVRNPLEFGTKYWTADIFSDPVENSWCGDSLDLRWLSLGLIHLTSDAAKLHASALASFTRKVD